LPECKPNSFSCRQSAWIAGSSPAMTFDYLPFASRRQSTIVMREFYFAGVDSPMT
jgi:hypothetical protein